MSRRPATAALLDDLQAARNAGTGWGYRAGGPPRVEPTLYALLALEAAGVPPPADALNWLLAQQQPDGSWGGHEGQAPWVTAPAVYTLARLRQGVEARRRGEEWLLATRSATVPGDEAVLSTDTRLVAWSWTAETLAWVEPTAHALIALRTVGRQDARRDDARRFLLDRRCEQGGWNYGIVRVLGAVAPPYPYTTALALIALATPATSRTFAPDVAVLVRFLDEPLGAFDLAWIALALDACGADPAPALERLAAALADASPWEEHVHARALALLASTVTKGDSPFRLPA